MPRWVVRAIAAAFILAALASAVLVFVTIRDLSLSWSGPGFGSLGSFDQAPQAGTQVAGTPSTGGSAMEQLPEPWSGTERVTILFMGLDYRDWLEGDGPPRTDTMILATIDPLTETAGLLSIPRDLWVEIPGFGHNRINTAYFLGETNQLPGGGPALAMETVENLLGVQVQYYALVDFSASERMIDEIAGLE
ncbi:MAG TPA: LytR family transcriptional regulator, partial [Chloroflexi bacterium]|nr:LytR family transcriptional regulator [Chloroflexota bacterium]